MSSSMDSDDVDDMEYYWNADDNLNEENYPLWSSKMKFYLKDTDLWSLVEKPPSDAEKGAAEWNSKNQRALWAIVSRMGNNVFHKSYDITLAHVLWERLADSYKNRCQAAVLQVWKSLMKLQMDESESITKHISKVQNMFNVVTGAGVEVSEGVQVITLLGTLSTKFQSLVYQFLDLDKSLTWKAVIPLLERVESAIELRRFPRESYAPHSSGQNRKFRNFNCYNCGKPGHFARDCFEI